jgi:hypothetical protein
MKRHTRKARMNFLTRYRRKLELVAIAFVILMIVMGVPNLIERCAQSSKGLPIDCQCQLDDGAQSAFNLSCDCLASPSS